MHLPTASRFSAQQGGPHTTAKSRHHGVLHVSGPGARRTAQGAISTLLGLIESVRLATLLQRTHGTPVFLKQEGCRTSAETQRRSKQASRRNVLIHRVSGTCILPLALVEFVSAVVVAVAVRRKGFLGLHGVRAREMRDAGGA